MSVVVASSPSRYKSACVSAVFWLIPLIILLFSTDVDPAEIGEATKVAPAGIVSNIADQLEQSHPRELSSQQRQELKKILYGELGNAWLFLTNNGVAHPDFSPSFNQAFNKAAPNPDTIYYVAPITDNGVYRLSGFRGSVHMVDVQIGDGSLLTEGTGPWGKTLHNYDLNSLNISEAGEFDVVLSQTRPASHQGDWWPLAKGATYLLIRQVSYDWLNEEDARIAIDRIDIELPRPTPTESEIEKALEKIPAWVHNWGQMQLSWIERVAKRGPVNTSKVMDYSGQSGISDQRYVEGVYDISSDEALILEVEVPEQCRYWSFHLIDELWRTTPWMDRQSSLNGHQAEVDGDGKFRVVISHRDPGIHNWLDTAGYHKGMILGRWKQCSQNPNATITKLKLKDVIASLPEDTALITPSQRMELLR